MTLLAVLVGVLVFAAVVIVAFVLALRHGRTHLRQRIETELSHERNRRQR